MVERDRPANPHQAIMNLLAGRTSHITGATLRELLAHEPRIASLVRAGSRRSSFEVVSPRSDNPEAGSPFSAVDPSLAHTLPDLQALLARHDLVSTRQSSMARLLRRDHLRTDIDRHDARARADRLDRLVTVWLRQRLWSINLAPELVAHDERHVAAVEDLLSDLVAPFLTDAENLRMSTLEAEWLAVAAWLHDWGHVGGPVAPFRLGAGYPMVSTSREVRLLHGLVSQQLMGEHWRGMHHLPPEIAQPAAVLCGHHQSWTSFGTEIPKAESGMPGGESNAVALLYGLGVPPVSLKDDLGAIASLLPAHIGLHRFKLLVALLRVADGADVGKHRVSDLGPARRGFLAKCLHWEALRVASTLAARPRDPGSASVGIGIAMGVAIEALHAANTDDFEHHLSEIVDHEIIEIAALGQYANFIRKQEPHFEKHKLVAATRFEHVDGQFDVVVVPVPMPGGTTSASQAVNAVANDIRRELEKADVGQILNQYGVRFGCVRTAAIPSGESYSVAI